MWLQDNKKTTLLQHERRAQQKHDTHTHTHKIIFDYGILLSHWDESFFRFFPVTLVLSVLHSLAGTSRYVLKRCVIRQRRRLCFSPFEFSALIPLTAISFQQHIDFYFAVLVATERKTIR